MKKTLVKILICALITVGSLFLLEHLSDRNQPVDFIETSFVGILQRIVDMGSPEDPVLSIEKVVLDKVSAPFRNSNHYKYSATVFIKNEGRAFRNLDVSLSADNTTNPLILGGSGVNFSLTRDETYIIDDYEIVFDGNYNVGSVTLNLNNEDFYTLEFIELPSKITDLEIKDISSDGNINLSYSPSNLFLDTDEFEFFFTDSLDLRSADISYREVFTQNKVYGYHVVKMSEDLLLDRTWESVEELKIDDGPFDSNENYFFHVRSINQETGYYGVSDILMITPHREMKRGEFAKLFVDHMGVKMFDAGELAFSDVTESHKFAPYVQTLFNLGLIDHTSSHYLPDTEITRGDVLIILMDYLDIDLVGAPGKSRFEDIEVGNFLYHYTQSLFEGGHASVFGDYFYHDLPATKSYLNHLINAYR